MQYERIQEYSDPFTHPHSPLRESLSRTLQVMCKQAAREISTLPDDTFAWPMADCGGYVRRLRVDPTAQLSRPTLGVSA